MAKEKDLCRAVAMALDFPVLLQRAIDAYEYDSLTPLGEKIINQAKKYLLEVEKLNRKNDFILTGLQEMSGLDISDIGYEDD